MNTTYDRIGTGYADVRQPEPRIAAQIEAALGDAETVVNIGAGTGSYEPSDRSVVAVEPSTTMIAQRRDANRVVRAVAEALPFADAGFDASLACLTVHHWSDEFAGLAEMCRVAPRRVIFAFDWEKGGDYWLFRDYLPEVRDLPYERTAFADAVDAVGGRVEVVPVPHDCVDGFGSAYWRRPERYLDADVQAGISFFNTLDRTIVERALGALRGDLESGRWHARNAELLERDAVDFGYRLIISE